MDEKKRVKKEYGGYLPLELPDGDEYYTTDEQMEVMSLNSGRAAIVLALLTNGAKCVHLPYYICQYVPETIKKYGISVKYYNLTDDMKPSITGIAKDEWILCVNYFGFFSVEDLESIRARYGRVIFDNTQGFFTKPILAHNCYNVYSMRKFFGVSDGAYLIYGKDNMTISTDGMEMDYSSNRSGYLMKSIEYGTNAMYQESLENEEAIGMEKKLMSPLTRKILRGINYNSIRKKRQENLTVIRQILDPVNSLPLDIKVDNLMIYPLYCEKKDLRRKFIDKHIYVPQWWKWVMKNVDKGCVEYKFSDSLFPIPIDQRYGEDDMKRMGQIILSLINDSRED